jgi:acyl-CoA synthetase (AMP-forming)/AMP-acid ligase II
MNLGSGGAVFSQALKDELKELVPTAGISDGMGASETGIAGMAEPSDEGVMRLPASGNQQVVAGGRICAVGETGFVARTGNTPVGYYNDPEKTAEVFQTLEGKLWAVSGDAARLDADGRITVFGRGSTCINSGGEKIFPEEVEEALRSHPAVFDAVVAGQADSRWGERVVAVLSPRQGVEKPSLSDLKNSLCAKLAGYKLPRALVWVDEIRRSPAGKQDYQWAKSMAEQAS